MLFLYYVICNIHQLEFMLLTTWHLSIFKHTKIFSWTGKAYIAVSYGSIFAGNIRVFCRARPLFEDEGSSVVEFPDDYTIRVNTGDESLSNSKKEFEFDRVYGPHVGQGKLVPFYITAFLVAGVGTGREGLKFKIVFMVWFASCLFCL